MSKLLSALFIAAFATASMAAVAADGDQGMSKDAMKTEVKADKAEVKADEAKLAAEKAKIAADKAKLAADKAEDKTEAKK